jgi:hypothetical protein
LHHKIAGPGLGLRQGQSKANPELLSINAFTTIDYTVNAAVRRQWANGWSTWIRRRYNSTNWNKQGLRNLNSMEFETSEIGAGAGLRGFRSRNCAV